MNFIEACESDRQRFNEFVAGFATGDLLQSFEWGDLKSHYGWQPIRLCAEHEGRIVAAASLLKRTIPRTKRCILYAPRGPVLDTHNAQLVNAFCRYIRETAHRLGAILVKIDPPIPIEDSVSESNLRAAGFRPVTSGGFGGTQPKAVMQLDLDKTEEELLASFKPKWRYNIRLAQKKGVEVRLHSPRTELPIFYKLLKITAERDRFLVRDLGYFERMWDVLVPPGYMQLAMAYYEGQPVAGALVYLFGDRAMYTYGASSNEHRNVMPNHLLQWTLIRWAKEQGCKWYDFRGVSPRKDASDEDDLQGLNRFKSGFSPRYVEYIGEYDMPLSTLLYWLWSALLPRIRGSMRARRMAESE